MWKISTDPGEIYEHPSKEAAFLSRRLDELSWRQGGAWSDNEIERLKEMLTITRDKSAFDARYVFDNIIYS